LTDQGKESLVGRADVGSDVLLVDTVTDAAPTKFVDDFRAVPVFVKIES
jgi:hypothetical protein